MVPNYYLNMQIRKFRGDESGNMLMLFAFSMPLILGFLGLGIDVVQWYSAQQRLQIATDSGALAAAIRYSQSGDLNEAIDAAEVVMLKNGFSVEDGRTITINQPPSTGAYTGDATAIEVLSTELQPSYFAAIIFSEDVTVNARAVATNVGGGEHCILGLDPSADDTVYVFGNSDVELDCGVASNSSSSEGLSVQGNADLTATNVTTVGGYSVTGNATLDSDTTPVQGSGPIADPYGPEGRNLSVPSYGGCDYNNVSVKKNTTLSPGVYCGGLTVQKGTATFNPGIYILNGGEFRVNAQGTVVAIGVTFILTGSGSDYATVRFNGGADITVEAPQIGDDPDFAGVAFYQDRNAPFATNQNKFNGGSTMDITGAVYFPSQEIEFTGGNNTGGSGCLQLVARRVTVGGNADMGINCAANSGVSTIASNRLKLVE